MQKLVKDNAGVGYCPSECRGRSTKPGITPLGTCHLSTDKEGNMVELAPKLANGRRCLEDYHCQSDWCYDWKCRKKYGYLQPNPGLCGADSECSEGLRCDSRCAYAERSRKLGESCTKGKHIECAEDPANPGSFWACETGKCGPLHWPRLKNEKCVLGTIVKIIKFKNRIISML